MIPLLTDLARNAVKEKVIRVVVATFRNLVVKAPAANLAAMLVAKLLPFVQSLASRKWSDEEIKEDIDFLVDELKQSFEGLTYVSSSPRRGRPSANLGLSESRTYDEYISELESGQLSWSPPHKNDDFWRENAGKLNDKDRKQLKCASRAPSMAADADAPTPHAQDACPAAPRVQGLARTRCRGE